VAVATAGGGSRLSAASPPADRDPVAQLRVQLYSKLAAALSVAGTTAQPARSMLSLLFPGYFVQPNLDPKDRRTQYIIANAFNLTLACSWVAEPGAATISDVYKGILDGKQAPIIHLTPPQQQELERAQRYLFGADGQPTAAYQDYQRYQLAYLQALDTYEAALATERNGGARVPPDVRRALTAAEQGWRTEGHRRDVELALAAIAEYEALEPLLYWSSLAKRYREWTYRVDLDSEFQFVSTNPPYERWFDEFGWSEFAFDQSDFDRQPRSGGAGLRPTTCCCHSGPPGPGPGDPGITMVKLTCKLRRIEIVRPWLDANVFHSRAWRWQLGSVGFGSVISTGGDIAGAVAPTGVMPVLPMTAIMARDLVLVWRDRQAAADVRARLNEGTMSALGPFRLADSGQAGDEHRLEVPDPQIIGFLSPLIPRCPNPDPVLPWPLRDSTSSLARLPLG
jgi:hypothetical protein